MHYRRTLKYNTSTSKVHGQCANVFRRHGSKSPEWDTYSTPTTGSEAETPRTRRATATKKTHHAATRTQLDVRLVGEVLALVRH